MKKIEWKRINGRCVKCGRILKNVSILCNSCELEDRANAGAKPPTIKRVDLARLAYCNSPKLPQAINDDGRRKRWVGIGWVDEGPAHGDEVIVL